ncbi:olfactory receptor 14J1-like, partial [Empidonax traillii]|uniref:olfactory receptor 14J1-like n=1 Tax=Empidonax traillii TaxID=164674 RepID=UPI000FFDB169
MFNKSSEYCVQVIVIPKIYFHPENYVYDSMTVPDHHLAKREPITAVTVALLMLAGGTGAGTGIASLVRQNREFSALKIAIDEDIARIEESITALANSLKSLSEEEDGSGKQLCGVPPDGWRKPLKVAICKPLHYGTLLGSRACAHMAAAAWASGFLNAMLHTTNTFSLPLCQGNALGQFFCEIPHILKLSCSHSGYLRELGLILFSVCLVFGCFIFIVFSYVQIFRAVLRIPSEQGRHKAFSMCLPHLAVVSLFLSTATFSNLKPLSISSPSLDLTLSVLYSVVPPALNPLIYSLRNQELKDAIKK